MKAAEELEKDAPSSKAAKVSGPVIFLGQDITMNALIRKCFWADGWDAHQFCKSLLFPSLLMIFVSKHHIVLGILYTFKVELDIKVLQNSNLEIR